MKSFNEKSAFTLIEMLVVSVILWSVLTTVLSVYFKITEIKAEVVAKTKITKDTNELAEKINLNMKNYIIDYEEYFNRKQVWCDWDWWDDFSRDVWGSWYCTKFTHYWNANAVDRENATNNILYYCTSKANWEEPGDSDCEWNDGNGASWNNYIYSNTTNLLDWFWCIKEWLQSFGQYKLQFWDVKGNADWTWGCQWDDDDTDLGRGPVAIGDNKNVKELYLISKDQKKRILLRRKLVTEEDFDLDWETNTTWEKLYKLQILKLRGFDIGSWHIAGQVWPTVNDGKIDTWACDAKEWFICNWENIWWWYTNYNLPENVDDWRTDLTSNEISLEEFNFEIFPTKYYDYAWYESDFQIAPYIKMQLKTRFYPTNYRTKLNLSALMKYTTEIQTTFSIKPY